MYSPIILISFFIVIFISLVASFIASRTSFVPEKKQNQYFLACRSLRWPLLLGTLVGTQVGGGFILGNTDASFEQGLFGGMYSIGIALGMLGLGLGYAARLRTLDVSTLPELLEKRYRCSWMKKSAAIISVLSLGGILMCQAIGLQKFLLSCGYGPLIFLISWSIVVLYTTFGGLLAVVWTDTIQATVMIGILALIGIFTLLPYSQDILFQAQAYSVSFDAKIFSALLMPLCFMFVEQDMAQRCFSAKSPKDATIGTLLTAVVLILLTIIPTSCGILGRSLGASLDQGSIFMQVMQKIANPFVLALAGSAVLLAIISTASSLLLAVSSNIAQDLTNKQTCKRYTALVGILAFCGPYLANDIISGLVASYELSVATFFIPLMVAIFSKKTFLPREAGVCAAIFGLLGFCCSKILPQTPLTSLVSLLFSLIGFLLGVVYEKFFKKKTLQTSEY